VEGLNLGLRPKEDLIHKELTWVGLKMQKNLYEKLPKKHKLIFLAGLFDGEGSFGIWGKGNGRKSFQCSVEMCDKDIIQRFVDIFGGSILTVKIRNDKWKQTWRWRQSGKKAFASIEKMIDYMCQRRKDKYNVVKCNKISD
tara:strand:+ start:1036 stop:1458 length:423 start_codon:yes stop_codon:yes gene_type:complete